MEKFKDEVIRLYDLYLMQVEKRGISWGELAHIQNSSDEDLKELYDELLENIKEEEDGESIPLF